MAQKFVTPVTIRNLTSASSDGLAVSVDGDTNDRIKVEAGGRLVWGSGSATGDANLYRSGVGAVKTDHTFEAESGVITLTSSGAPTSTIADGAIAVDTTNSKFYYRSNSTWNTVSGGATVSTTAPSSPSEGDIWFDSNTGDTLVYYGSVWVDVGGSSVANIAVQTTAPSNPVNGDLWFDTDTAKTYVWYDDGTSAQWVEVGAASAAASGTDGAIQFASGGTFSSDASNLHWDDTNNRLGIGTTSPSQPLHVVGNAKIDGNIVTASDALISNGLGEALYLDQTNNRVQLNTGGNSRVTVDSSGNVGIGTTSPLGTLDISGNTETLIFSSPSGTNRYRFDANMTDAADYGFSLSYWDGSAYQRSLTLLDDGSVGIGTTTPQEVLGVDGHIDLVGTARRVVYGRQNEGGPFGLSIEPSGVRESGFFYRTTPDTWSFEDGNGTGIMTVDIPNSRVGIGTETPSAPLEISTSVNTEALRMSANFTAANQETYITAVDTGDSSILAAIGLGSTGGANDNDGAITFRTTTASSSSIPGTKMIIDKDGNVGIGTTSPTSKLHVAGTIYASGNISGSHTGSLDATGYSTTGQPGAPIRSHATASTPGYSSTGTSDSTRNHLVFSSPSYPSVGAIYTFNGNTYFANYSDYRLKDNVAPLANASDIVSNLNPISYTMLHSPETTHLGFLAHELQEHIPSAVGGEKDKVDDEGNPVYQNVDLSKVVPVLTAALKEALNTITDLTARVEALEAN